MNDENIVAMNKAISRTNGLYQKWFQEHTINSYLVQTLNALYMEPELSQSKISDYYKIPRQTVNNAIQTLRRWGYIELLPDERDKRWKRIVFTESGTAYAQETITPLLLLDRSIAERMGSTRYRQLISLMNDYGDILEQAVSTYSEE